MLARHEKHDRGENSPCFAAGKNLKVQSPSIERKRLGRPNCLSEEIQLSNGNSAEQGDEVY